MAGDGSNQFPRDGQLDPRLFDTGTPRPGAGQDVAVTTARRAQAVSLRLAGLTYQQIADQVGYSDRSVARQAVVAALEQVQADGVEQLREVESMRLDRLQAAAWQQAMRGDVAAIRECRRLIETRAKLLGLNAPLQVELVGDVDAQLGELRAAMAEDPPLRIIEGEVA